MKLMIQKSERSFLLWVVSFCIVSWSNAHGQSDQNIPEHRSRACLYMMRNLEYTFQTWRSPDASAEELGEWVRRTRTRLNQLQVNAETYDLDEDIINAYQDVHSLLDDYELFLKDVVYFDLTSNVARPEQRTFLGESSGAAQMALGGLGSGSAFGPVGAVIGLAVGGAAGAYTGFDNYSSTISKDDRITATVKEAKLRLIAQLKRKFETTEEKLKTRAKLLGGQEKYGWGSEVGFDGSSKLSFEIQSQLRPNDAFLYLSSAIQLADDSPEVSFERMLKAAALVPADFGVNSDIFDGDRADMLITAMQIAEDGVHAGKCSANLAQKAVSCYADATGRLKNGAADLKPESRILFARVCGLAGWSDEGCRATKDLANEFGDDPWFQYELACAACLCNDLSGATQHLEHSATLLPRWQPAAVTDPRLQSLRAAYPGTVEKYLCHPLVGSWKNNSGLMLDFYLDGRLRQTRTGDVKNGSFKELPGDELELTTAGILRTFSYKVANNSLTLTGNGKSFELFREPPPLVGLWKYSDNDWFDFREDGTWTNTKRSESVTGTYMIIPGKAGEPPIVRYTRDRKSLYQPIKFAAFRVSGNTLSVTPVGTSKSYDYHR